MWSFLITFRLHIFGRNMRRDQVMLNLNVVMMVSDGVVHIKLL